MVSDIKTLTKLGSNTKYLYNTPNKKTLETFINQHHNDYLISFKCPEFTSLCPKTGQPDFATIYIQYIPNKLCVESKSLKLYLFSFRQFGEFHEDCVNRIMKDIKHIINPKWIKVEGQFRPRGGISIVPISEYKQRRFTVPEYARETVYHEYTVS